MGTRLSTLMAFLTIFSVNVFAQWDVQFSDYTTLKSFHNPAVSGVDGKLNVMMAYSMQMAGYDNAPSTMFVGADVPVYFLGPRHGAGASLLSDVIGMFKTQKISIQYSYNLSLGKRGRLSFGVQGAMLSETIDPSGVELEDNNDPAFPSSMVEGTAFDVGMGVYYTESKWWAGLSGMHLMSPLIEMGERHEIEISPLYYLMGGYNIKLKNSLLTLQPSFLVQTDLQSWREDVQCKVIYEYDEKKFFGGLGYSPNTSVTFMIGGNFHGVALGYSYQLYTTGVGAQHGTHELVVNYITELDLFKKGRNRHKSVRFL
jgi:type IX secretion system PorP/SprF family membrane protein